LPSEVYEEEYDNGDARGYKAPYELRENVEIFTVNEERRKKNAKNEAFILQILACQKNMESLANCLMHCNSSSNLKECDYAGFVALRHRRVKCILVKNDDMVLKNPESNCVYIYLSDNQLCYLTRLNGKTEEGNLKMSAEICESTNQLLRLLQPSTITSYPLEPKRDVKIMDEILSCVKEYPQQRPFGEVLSKMVAKYDALKQCANSIAHGVLKTHVSAMSLFGRTQAEINASKIQYYQERYSKGDFEQIKMTFFADLDLKIQELAKDGSLIAKSKMNQLADLKKKLGDTKDFSTMKTELINKWQGKNQLAVMLVTSEPMEYTCTDSAQSWHTVDSRLEQDIPTTVKTVETHRNKSRFQNKDAITDSAAMIRGLENALEFKLQQVEDSAIPCRQ
jgi:hypothetical protein